MGSSFNISSDIRHQKAQYPLSPNSPTQIGFPSKHETSTSTYKNRNISRKVLVTEKSSGLHMTIEDVDSRRRRRETYIRALCDLVNKVRNEGFNAQQFEQQLRIHKLVDITLHRHNDLVETFTAAARRHGIVFFLDAKDMYYVDDLHARAWKLSLRPRISKVTAGSGRGLKQLLKNKGLYLISKYGMSQTAKNSTLITDIGVSRYNKIYKEQLSLDHDMRSSSGTPEQHEVKVKIEH